MINQIASKARDIQVAQIGLDVSSQNLAHAGDINYARKHVQLSDNITIQEGNLLIGTGVHIEGIYDARDAYLDTQVLQSSMDIGVLNGRYQGLKAIQNGLEENIDRRLDAPNLAGAVGFNTMPLGISKSMDDFFSSISRWAGTPTLLMTKEQVLSNAQLLAKNFNRVDTYLNQVSEDANASMTQAVSKVNDLLDHIALINQDIIRLEIGSPGAALDLRGQRQIHLEELGALIGFSVSESDLNSSAIKISTKDSSGNEIVLLDAAECFGPLEVTGSDVVSNGSILAINKGSISGYQSTLQSDVLNARSFLDSIAGQLVQSVNGIYNPSSAASEYFFDPSGVTAATFSVDANLNAQGLKSSQTALSGANEIALSLEGLYEYAFSTTSGDLINGTFLDAYSAGVTNVAQEIHTIEVQIGAVEMLHEQLTEDRTNKIGVSYEEELASLMTYSHLFQANLKVLYTFSECLDRLLQLVDKL